ncbi:hypothetical protein [Cardinium endosymbiont of Nabis limbatus]|uniref:hypothetical protein n=1 Tax=Cardinium endosymbiont of Nabis limbatus TaxID=3066217 RepID=UPI003AF36CA1
MPLLEDNPSKEAHLTIARFEKALMQLLQSHADDQKKIIQLTADNKRLKELLEAPKTNLNRPTAAKDKALLLDNDLTHQINKYIKEIDLCLAYFEQT